MSDLEFFVCDREFWVGRVREYRDARERRGPISGVPAGFWVVFWGSWCSGLSTFSVWVSGSLIF